MKKTIEEVLEAIWKADEEGKASLGDIQRSCPIPVTDDDLALLRKRGLITREADRIALTDAGRTEARGVVRRHRLAECLLATALDLDADRQEEVACEVEHTLVPELEEGICTLLGHPAICPDGKPIPPGRCCNAKRTTATTAIVNLTELEPGERGRISYILPKHHDRLHRLASFGVTAGTVIALHQRSPAYCIRFDGTELALDRDVAEDIFVARIE
jgi:DtxR family Mn-dependent transcriptional regulator